MPPRLLPERAAKATATLATAATQHPLTPSLAAARAKCRQKLVARQDGGNGAHNFLLSRSGVGGLSSLSANDGDDTTAPAVAGTAWAWTEAVVEPTDPAWVRPNLGLARVAAAAVAGGVGDHRRFST
uniref:Uncharacterized protein n=1 Tax=Oryza sativa subsp. japonica TaxID=39947 RepID=Q6ER44_ORYSJ|nr:hypothetical protein [Oryza sativa Japonica Group]